MNITNIKALRFSIKNCFRIPFTVAEGYFKFQGSLLSKNDGEAICLLNCMNFNTKIFFGKGFKTVKDFMSKINITKAESC